MNGKADPATSEAESFLREELASNQREGIYPSRNLVVERLLSRRDDLSQDFYPELHRDLPFSEQRRAVLIALVHAAAFGCPERVDSVRRQLRCARDIDRKIQDIALSIHALVGLLEQRREECPAVASLELPNLHDALEEATDYSAPDTAYLFESHVAPHLTPLGRFDGKYWPTTEDLLLTLATALMNETAEDRPPRPLDPLMNRVIEGGNRSRADYTRALDAVIDDMKRAGWPQLPADFSLSSRALDCFVAVTLDLDTGDGTIRRQRRRAKIKDTLRAKRG